MATTPLRTTSTNLENSIVNALLGMLYQPEERRLTQAELDERVDLVRFETIVNPINTVCSITQDAFEPTQRVARIRHCGHIFNADSLAHWLRMNNTCPTCRHNLLTSSSESSGSRTSATTSSNQSARTSANAETTTNTVPRTNNTINGYRRIDIPLESEININTFYNELLQNSQNIPGFEFNSVNDDSIIFSFDLMSNGLRNASNSSTRAASSNATADSNVNTMSSATSIFTSSTSGGSSTSSGATSSGSSSNARGPSGPQHIDDVD